MFDTIHHIAIIGSDYERSKHFYVDLLGFQIIRENYRAERDDYKIDLACRAASEDVMRMLSSTCASSRRMLASSISRSTVTSTLVVASN